MRPVVVPLSPKRYKIQFTASEETHDLLRRVQDLLRHQIPSSDVGEVVAKALRLLVKHLEKEKFAATDHPRDRRDSDPHSRHIPAEVRRSVWQRDGGQCPLWDTMASAVWRDRPWSFTMSKRTRRAGKRPKPTLSSGAERTTPMRPGSILDHTPERQGG